MHWFESILMAALGAGIAVLLWPEVKRSIEEGEQAKEGTDWAGFLLPIGLVVLLVIVVIYISYSS